MAVDTPSSVQKFMLCPYCGEEGEPIVSTKAIVPTQPVPIHARKNPEPMKFQEKPCKKCQQKFRSGYLFFEGECGHSGFVLRTSLKQVVSKEVFKRITGNVFRMEACFKCLDKLPQD